jgi:hypothetical protein
VSKHCSGSTFEKKQRGSKKNLHESETLSESASPANESLSQEKAAAGVVTAASGV